MSALALPPSSTSVAPAQSSAQVATGTAAPWSQTRPEATRRPGLMVGATAVVLFIVAAVAAGVIIARRPAPPSLTSAASPVVSVAVGAPATVEPTQQPVVPVAPAGNQSPPVALATEASSRATPNASTKPLPSRKDIKQKNANEHEAAQPVASAAPKGSQESHNKSKPGGSVTDFGGRLY